MSLEIPLNFSRADFEEIYFLNDRGHSLKDPSLKPVIRNFFISIVATVIAVGFPFLIFDPASKDSNLGFLIFFGLGFCIGQLAVLIFGIQYFAMWRGLKVWKREINRFLDAQEKVQHHSLNLSDEYFCLKEDAHEKIEKWSNFNKVELDGRYIILASKEHYLIPAKSMTVAQFEKLGKLVSERVRMSKTPE